MHFLEIGTFRLYILQMKNYSITRVKDEVFFTATENEKSTYYACKENWIFDTM